MSAAATSAGAAARIGKADHLDSMAAQRNNAGGAAPAAAHRPFSPISKNPAAAREAAAATAMRPEP